MQYRSGDLIKDPGRIALYTSKVKDRKIVEVNEHNLDDIATYLELRRDVKDAKKLLTKYLKAAKKPANEPVKSEPESESAKYSDPAYIEKVNKLAAKHKISTEGKSIEELVAEIKSLG